MFNDSMLEIEELRADLATAQQEIQRLKTGGCARDQGTTQFCAEAVEIARERDRLRGALETAMQSAEHAEFDHNIHLGFIDGMKAALDAKS